MARENDILRSYVRLALNEVKPADLPPYSGVIKKYEQKYHRLAELYVRIVNENVHLISTRQNVIRKVVNVLNYYAGRGEQNQATLARMLGVGNEIPMGQAARMAMAFEDAMGLEMHRPLREIERVAQLRIADFGDEIQELRKIVSRLSDAKNVPPEAPADAELGSWAFGEERPAVPMEKDTEEEEDLLFRLKNHFGGGQWGDSNLSRFFARKIQGYLKDNQYTYLFDFPEAKYDTVYRGMNVPPKVIFDMLGEDDDVVQALRNAAIRPNTQVHLDREFVFEPRGDTSSWSVDYDIAHNFTQEGNYGDYGIVLSADAMENADRLIINPDTIYSVETFEEFDQEREVIAVGPVKVFAVDFFFYGKKPRDPTPVK
jgi:hypothetical protein